MDLVLELEFSVWEILHGEYEGETIRAVDFTHSSAFPEYVIETPPLYIALTKENNTFFVSRTAVMRDVNGEEWICGAQLNPLVKDDSPHAPPYSTFKGNDCPKGVEIERMKKYLNNLQ